MTRDGFDRDLSIETRVMVAGVAALDGIDEDGVDAGAVGPFLTALRLAALRLAMTR